MDVTKTEAAQQQLTTAIRLYFEDRDPISVHTLAMAASEIIDQLCRSNKVPSMRDEMMADIDPVHHKMVFDALHKSRNFFKHASPNRPNEVLRDFNDDQNLYAVLVACEGLRRFGIRPREATIFTAWVAVILPVLAHDPPPADAVAAVFGDIGSLSRAAQKECGRDALLLAAAHPGS